MMSNSIFAIFFILFTSSLAFAQLQPSAEKNASPHAAVSIYPNPAVDHIIIELGQSYLNPEFELNSMIGNTVAMHVEDLGNGKFKVDVKKLHTGYYFLAVTDKKSKIRVAHKFLKN